MISEHIFLIGIWIPAFSTGFQTERNFLNISLFIGNKKSMIMLQYLKTKPELKKTYICKLWIT